MAFKFVVLAACLAVANAGVLQAPAVAYHGAYAAAPAAVAYGHPSVAVASPAITSQQQNTLRSYGNLGQVSTYSKTIDTPFSSVRKSDVRVSNDALAYAAAPAYAAYHGAPAYAAAPAYAGYHAAPAVAAYSAPVVARPAYAAAPAYAGYHAAPAVAAYSAPVVARPAYAAPAVAAYSAPVVAKTAYAAPAVAAHGGLLGVAYSAAPAVAHMTFSGLGVNYGW